MNDDNAPVTARNNAEILTAKAKNEWSLHSPKKKTTSLHQSINIKAGDACKNRKAVNECNAHSGIQYTNGIKEWSSSSSEEESIGSPLKNRDNIHKDAGGTKNYDTENLKVNCNDVEKCFEPLECPNSFEVTGDKNIFSNIDNSNNCFEERNNGKGNSEEKNRELINDVLNQNVVTSYSKYKIIPKNLPTPSYVTFSAAAFLKHFHNAFLQVDGKLNTRDSTKSCINENIHNKPNNIAKDSSHLSPNKIHKTRETMVVQSSPKSPGLNHAPNTASKIVVASHVSSQKGRSKNELKHSNNHEKVKSSPVMENVKTLLSSGDISINLPVSENVNGISSTSKQENVVSHSSPVKTTKTTAPLQSHNSSMRFCLNKVDVVNKISQRQDSNLCTVQCSPRKTNKQNANNNGENSILTNITGTSMPFEGESQYCAEVESAHKIKQKLGSSKDIIQNSLQKFSGENTVNDKDDDSIPTHVSNSSDKKQNRCRNFPKDSRLTQKKHHLSKIMPLDHSQKSKKNVAEEGDNSTSCILSLSTVETSTSIQPKSAPPTNKFNQKLYGLQNSKKNSEKNNPCENLLFKSSKKQKMQTLKKSPQKIKINIDITPVSKQLDAETTISGKGNSIFQTLAEEKNMATNRLLSGSPKDFKTAPKNQNCLKEPKLHHVKNNTPITAMINCSFESDVLDYEVTDTDDISAEVFKGLPTCKEKKQNSPKYPKFNGTYTNQIDFKNFVSSTVPTSASECRLDNKERSAATINTTESELNKLTADGSSKSNEPFTASKCKEIYSSCKGTELSSTSKCKKTDIISKDNELSLASDNKETAVSCKSKELFTPSEYKEPDISCQNKELTTDVKSSNMQDYCRNNELAMDSRLANKSSKCKRFRYQSAIDDSSESELSSMEDNYVPYFRYQPCMTFHQPYSNSSVPQSQQNEFVFKKPLLKKPKKKKKTLKKNYLALHSTPTIPEYSADELQIFASDTELDIDENLSCKRVSSPKNESCPSSEQISVEVEHTPDSSGEKNIQLESIGVKKHNIMFLENCPQERSSNESRAKSPQLLPISYKRYCRSFLKNGSCPIKCCKYIHNKPDFSELQAPKSVSPINKSPEIVADPRKAVFEFSQKTTVIEDACKSGLLEKAFDDSRNFFSRNPPSELKDRVINMLIEASVRVGDDNNLHDISQRIFKDFRMLDKMHCSNFIMACNSKPRKTFKSAVEIFETCFSNMVPLQLDAITALHDIFCLDRSQWNLTLRLMLYKSRVCHQNIDMRELKEALSVCVHCSDRNDQKFTLESLSSILNILSDVEFKQLAPETIRSLVSLLKQFKFPRDLVDVIEHKTNKYFGLPRFPDYANAKQLPYYTAPSVNPNQQVSISQKISSAVGRKDWNTVTTIFRQCISRLDYQPLMHLQLSLLSEGSDIFERFSGFITAVTSRHNAHITPDLTLQEKFVLAQIGAIVLEETYHKQNVQTAYSILKLLHHHNINYFEVQQVNPKRRMLLSYPCLQGMIVYSWDIALVAINVCLSNRSPLDALNIMSKFHDKLSDDTVATENWSRVACQRVRLATKMAQMLLKQKKNLSHCEQALNYLMDFTTDDSRNFLSEKVLEEVKLIFNRYLVECLNSHNLEKAESFLETITDGELFADIKPEVLRGLLVKYYSIGEEKKAETLFQKCSFCGLYSLAIPNVHSQPREICLSTKWSYYELRIILNDTFKKIYEMLDPYNQNYTFEDWFSLSFKLEEPASTSESQFSVDGVSGISTHIKDFTVRVLKALKDMGFSWKDTVEDYAQHSIKIQPTSLYQMFTEWKNNSETKDSTDSSKSNSFEWPGQTSHNFGSQSSSESELRNSRSEIDNEVPQPVKKKPCMEKGISYNEYVSPSKSSSLPPEEEVPPKKSKIRYKKALTSGTFSCTEAKNMGLRISLNSGGREIISQGQKNDSAEGASQTEKCVSPNKSPSASPSKNVNMASKAVTKDPKFDWITPTKNQPIKRKLVFCEETSTSTSSQGEQTFSPIFSKPETSGDVTMNFKERQFNSAADSSSTSINHSYTKLDLLQRSRHHHTVKHKSTCWKASLNRAVPSTSSHFVNFVGDSTKSGVKQLRYSLMVLINQKRKNLSSEEKEEIASALMENFLAKYEVTEIELSEKRTRINLVKFAEANL